MKSAFATLVLLFSLFTCTAAQSPIVTTSTSNVLSDDMQTDDFSEISTPDDDMSSALDDSSQALPSDVSSTSDSTGMDDATDDTMGNTFATPAPSGESDPANATSGAAELWAGSLSVASTAAVAVLGVISLRFAGEL